MLRLIYALLVICMITPPFTADAGLPHNVIAVLAGPADGPRLPGSSLDVNPYADSGAGQYVQNLATDTQPELTDNDGAQPPAAAVRGDADGFQGGSTFDHFDDQRRTAGQENGALPIGSDGNHEPPDQSDLDHYNMMMRAWQKDK